MFCHISHRCCAPHPAKHPIVFFILVGLFHRLSLPAFPFSRSCRMEPGNPFPFFRELCFRSKKKTLFVALNILRFASFLCPVPPRGWHRGRKWGAECRDAIGLAPQEWRPRMAAKNGGLTRCDGPGLHRRGEGLPSLAEPADGCVPAATCSGSRWWAWWSARLGWPGLAGPRTVRWALGGRWQRTSNVTEGAGEKTTFHYPAQLFLGSHGGGSPGVAGWFSGKEVSAVFFLTVEPSVPCPLPKPRPSTIVANTPIVTYTPL